MPTLLNKERYSGTCHSEHVELRRQLWAPVFTVRLVEGRLSVLELLCRSGQLPGRIQELTCLHFASCIGVLG